MTKKQLQHLLRWAIRYVQESNQSTREVHMHPVSKRIQPSSVALEVAKTDVWLAKARSGVKR